MLHSADISNAVKPFHVAKCWSDAVFEEFLAQGDLEKKNGIPISPYMDRNNTCQPKLSLNFLNFMVKPLFNALARFFPALSDLVRNMQDNVHEWETRMPASPASIPAPVQALAPAPAPAPSAPVPAPSQQPAQPASTQPPHPADTRTLSSLKGKLLQSNKKD